MSAPPIGALQGRLTPAKGRGIQFFPDGPGEWEKEFPLARDAGLSSIELLARPHGLREQPLMTEEGRTRLKELSTETGVRIPSVHAYYEKGDAYATDIHDIVTASAELGAATVLVSFFKEKALSLTRDETWERAHELLAPAARAALERGVKLGVEAEHTAETLLDFIAQAETPEVFGIYYDLGNQFACGFPVAEELRFLKEKVVGVHIKDRRMQVSGQEDSASVPLGSGVSNFREAFNALREIGYSQDLIIQGARGLDGDEVALYKQYRDFVETIARDVWA